MFKLIKAALLLLALLSTQTPAATTVRYQHTDILGSVVAETDAAANIISRSHYEPFGKRSAGDKAGISYTGHLQDEDLNLIYMQARYYDPVIGRFYSNDPVDALGHMQRGNNIAHGFNRYAYANNNPYKYTDPDGEFIAQAARTSFQVGWKIGGAINYGIQAATGASLGVLIYNAVHGESGGDPVDGIKEGKSSAKGEAGEKGQLEGSGGMSGALEDLGKIPLVEGSEWSKGDSQGGTIDDGSGRKVNVHPSGGGDSYPKGTPTLEVQKPNGKPETKIRYPEK